MKTLLPKPLLKTALLLGLGVLLAAALLTGCQPAATPTPTSTPTPTIPISPPVIAEPTQSEPTSYPVEPPAVEQAQTEMPGYPAPQDAQSTEQPAVEGPSGAQLAYPVPEDAALERANFFIDAARLVPVAGAPGTFDLEIEGSLPTPCNLPRVQTNPPNAQNQIIVEMYSVIDPEKACAQVIQPFSGTIATLSGLTPGSYTVIINEMDPIPLSVP